MRVEPSNAATTRAPLFSKAVILGATGPTGKHLARELCRRGVATRVVGRDPKKLATAFPDLPVDPVAADLRRPEDAARVLKACDVAFHCIGLPIRQIRDYLHSTSVIAEVAKEAEVRLVHVSSYWAYLPLCKLPLRESHPRDGGPLAATLRREAEDLMRKAGAAVINLPDFFGPEVHTSTLQRALEDMSRAKPVRWAGPATVEREYVYVPDAMRTVAEIATHGEAYGQRWLIGGSGPLSLERAAEIAGRHLGRKAVVRPTGAKMLRLLSLFSAELRAFLPLAPTYTTPIAYDDAKLQKLLGEVERTPYEQSIPATLDWLARSARANAAKEALAI